MKRLLWGLGVVSLIGAAAFSQSTGGQLMPTQTGITGFALPDGSATAPSYSFSTTPGSGMTRGSATLKILGNGNASPVPFGDSIQVLAGDSSSNNQAGGSIAITAGNGTAGAANGGNITLTGGASVGAGTHGRVLIPTATWLQQASGRFVITANDTNSTTNFSGTGLLAAVVTGRKYSFTTDLYITESTAADGVKVNFNAGNVSITNLIAQCQLFNAVGAAVTQGNAVTGALATTINAAATTDALQHVYHCSGTLEPSSTGIFGMQYAQNAHSTGTLTLLRGSWLMLEDMP